ncbi:MULTISPECIES: hypothetical protein [unclassified Sphingomonas]|uniref:hypothetical protein n=1 Tax=Sphingomonas sp. PvP015 TaxID=3156388 RepID=UPI00339AEE95
MPTVKLWELAALPDMPSAPTLRKFIRERADFPVIQYGRKGLDYTFDLDAAVAFVREHWRDTRSERSGVAPGGRRRPTIQFHPAQQELQFKEQFK